MKKFQVPERSVCVFLGYCTLIAVILAIILTFNKHDNKQHVITLPATACNERFVRFSDFQDSTVVLKPEFFSKSAYNDIVAHIEKKMKIESSCSVVLTEKYFKSKKKHDSDYRVTYLKVNGVAEITISSSFVVSGIRYYFGYQISKSGLVIPVKYLRTVGCGNVCKADYIKGSFNSFLKIIK